MGIDIGNETWPSLRLLVTDSTPKAKIHASWHGKLFLSSAFRGVYSSSYHHLNLDTLPYSLSSSSRCRRVIIVVVSSSSSHCRLIVVVVCIRHRIIIVISTPSPIHYHHHLIVIVSSSSLSCHHHLIVVSSSSLYHCRLNTLPYSLLSSPRCHCVIVIIISSSSHHLLVVVVVSSSSSQHPRLFHKHLHRLLLHQCPLLLYETESFLRHCLPATNLEDSPLSHLVEEHEKRHLKYQTGAKRHLDNPQWIH